MNIPNNAKKDNGPNYNYVEKIISLLVGVIIALILFFHNESLKKPELSGNIYFISALYNIKYFHPAIPKDMFTVFLTVANERDIPVPVIAYTLEAKYEDGSVEQFYPMFRDKSKYVVINFQKAKASLILPKKSQYLLNNLKTLVTRNHPLTGFICFGGDKKTEKPIKTFAVKLLDGYGNTYYINYKKSMINDLNAIKYLIKGSEIRQR